MRSMKKEALAILEGNIVPFWKSLRDNERGGYYGYMDQDLNLDKNAEKGCILNSRILWFFSKAALLLDREDLRGEAKHAYNFLKDYAFDKVNGGIYWSLNADGSVLDSTKHTYNQAFAIYALSAYYQLSRDPKALQLAYSLYELIETKCKDEGGYGEAFNEHFEKESNEKLSENGVMAERTMNTLLHVYEGYSGLYEATKDEKIKAAMVQILGIYKDRIYNKELRRQEVFFDKNYNSLIDLTSYGHDIESSWLIDEGAKLVSEPTLQKEIEEINIELAKAVYKRAFRKNSLRNECERGVENGNRVWWVQAEGVLGFLNLYDKTGDNLYRKTAGTLLDFIENKLIDNRLNSEWFWETDEDGKPIPNRPIVEPWKCPYHNGRMCMNILRRENDVLF